MQVFAKAIAGGDEKKLFEMMEAGQVISSEVLPKVAEEFKKAARNGDALKKSMQSNRAEMNRMSNNWKTMKDTFYTSGFSKAMVFLYQSLNKAMEAMEPMIPGFAKFFRLFTIGALLPFNLFVAAIKDLQKIFPSVDSEALNLGLSIVGVALGFGAAASAVLYFRKALMMLTGISAFKWLIGKAKSLNPTVAAEAGGKIAGSSEMMGMKTVGSVANTLGKGAGIFGKTLGWTGTGLSLWDILSASYGTGKDAFGIGNSLYKYMSTGNYQPSAYGERLMKIKLELDEGKFTGVFKAEIQQEFDKHNKNNLNEIIMNTPD